MEKITARAEETVPIRITENPENFIRFLGTAGTRFVMLSQRRASGGIWFSYGACRGVIDPGPGSLVQICKASPAISTLDVNTLILTHRHIDHSSDFNVLCEGMTLRSLTKKGQVLLTEDSIGDRNAVLHDYFAKKVERVYTHADGKKTALSDDVTVESVRHKHHGVQCFGLIFRGQGLPAWGVISDTRALPCFPKRYEECKMLIINVTLPHPWGKLDHISVPEVASLLQLLRPKLMILTHMGQQLLDKGPAEIARKLSTKDTRVVAAEDGLIVDLETAAQGPEKTP